MAVWQQIVYMAWGRYFVSSEMPSVFFLVCEHARAGPWDDNRQFSYAKSLRREMKMNLLCVSH